MPIASAPAEIAMTCLQGTAFQYVLQFFQDDAGLNPVDFTGYTFAMQIREGVADSGAPVVKGLSSEGSAANILFIGTVSDGSPDIDGASDPTNGMIYLHLSADETSKLHGSKAPKPRTYPAVSNFFYDIEATPPGGEPQRIIFGTFNLSLEVTRD